MRAIALQHIGNRTRSPEHLFDFSLCRRAVAAIIPMKRAKPVFSFLFFALIFSYLSFAFQSDELFIEDEDFGLEGGRATDLEHAIPTLTPSSRRRVDLDPSSDSKSVQFTLEHAFGDSAYSPAGTFTARLKTWSHGGKTLTKLRFSRNVLTEEEKDAFKRLLEEDNFYTIRVPSNVLNPPGKGYIMSSVRARCIPRESLDEHFVIHMVLPETHTDVYFAP